MNWLFPYAVGATTVATAATPAHSEPDCPSPSSPAFGTGGAGANKEADSGSSSSSASTSSSAADAFSFSTSGQRRPSTSTSALCFGPGGAGMRLWSSSKALARASNIHAEEDAQQAAPAASVAPKGYAVARHLRRISRRLRKARAANKELPAAPRKAAVDDTARDRAEAVATAVAHCKETLRRGTPWRRRLPLPLSSLSLDLWLRDRQDEIIASAAAHCDDECGNSRRPPAAAVFPTALACRGPCTRLPYIQGGHHYESAAVPAAATVTQSSSQTQTSGPVASRETKTRSGLSELEFLETFHGDEELIHRHFITVQI